MDLTVEQIDNLCREKEENLLKKYFEKLIFEASAIRPETIDENHYPLDLPLKIELEYIEYLEQLWPEVAPSDMKGSPLVLEEQKLREIVTENDRERLQHAYKSARTRNLWERITSTNHKDVTYYKWMLKEYARELMDTARLDFMEEITGNPISNKAFDE